MAVEIFTDMAPITFTPDGGSETTAPIFSASLSRSLANQAQRHSGRRFASTILHAGGSPNVSLTMPAKFALDNFGFGLNFLSDFKLFLATYADGERQSGANHTNLQAATAAYLVVDSISASNKGLATASCRLIPIAEDATSDPWTRNNSASLPSLASEPVLNTLGPMSNGGTVLDGLQSVSINLGQILEPIAPAGARYPQAVRYGGGNPTISGSTINTLGMHTLAGDEGVNVTDLSFFLRENDVTNGTLKATGIEINVSDGYLQADSESLSQDATTPTAFSVICESDSTTHPLSYTASTTIDT